MNALRKLCKNDLGILLILACGGVALHVLLNGQYGFHRDELDVILSARQLDWGYISYPPLAPFLARLGLILFGDSLRGLRLFSALGQGAVMVMAGWMARDLGGKRAAQVSAAVAAYIAPAALMAGTLIQYMAFDYVWWTLLAFCAVRLLTTENPRWWLGVGAAIGLGMMTKYTMLFFAAGFVVGVLLTRVRRYLLSAWLWAGVGLALLIFLPNLIWHIQHNFIVLDYLSAIHARDVAWGRTAEFLPDQLYISNNPFMLPLWIPGLVYLLILPGGRRFRALGWAFVVTFAAFLVSQGRGYYLSPAYVMLLAAGAVWWEDALRRRKVSLRRFGWATIGFLLVVGSLVGVVLIKPLAPVNSALWEITSEVNGELREMIGWTDLAAQVAAVYNRLPAEDRASTAILAGNYGEAGALDYYRQAYGLPPMISGSNSLWERGYGVPPPEILIVVGFERGYADSFFKTCTWSGTVTNAYGVENEESTRHTELYLCSQPRQPWEQMWKNMQWFQ